MLKIKVAPESEGAVHAYALGLSRVHEAHTRLLARLGKDAPARATALTSDQLVQLCHVLPRIPSTARHLGASQLRALLAKQEGNAGEFDFLDAIVASPKARKLLFASLGEMKRAVAALATQGERHSLTSDAAASVASTCAEAVRRARAEA